jgi:DNA-binding transcriptional ArsR family regulator
VEFRFGAEPKDCLLDRRGRLSLRGSWWNSSLGIDPKIANLIPQKRLDTGSTVTVWLRIMRNRAVTYSAETTFQALADPTRRAVLDLLRQGRQPAGHIARAFPVSRPAISKHLRLLRRAHLVEEHREGRHRLYQLNPEPLKVVDHWLESYRAFWSMSLANLKAFVEAEHAKETAEVEKRGNAKLQKKTKP